MYCPERSRRSHVGAAPAPIDNGEVAPPVSKRLWKVTPLPGLTRIIALGALAVRACRIISPPLAQLFVFDWLTTRAVTCTFPVAGWERKWKASAMP